MPGRVEVPRAPLRAPTFGLVSTARDATNDPAVGRPDSPARWESGVAWQPNCAAELGTWRQCVDEDAASTATKIIADRPSIVDVDSFTVWTGDRCSTLGGLTQDREQRATEQLANGQTKALELVLQDGLAGLDVPHLRDGNLVDLSPGADSSPLVYALAALEAAGADAGYPFIHATVQTVTLWYAARALERVGSQLYTCLGTPVITGAGYTGAAPGGSVDPTGETAYAYVTGAVTYRLGAVQVLGDERSIDRATNTWEVRAERQALVAFDPCVQVGIRVNNCETFCVPAGS